MRAAEHGLGVASGFFPLTTEWVTQGRLAVPLPQRFTLPAHIALVHRLGDDRFPYEELTQWLQQQYEALPALPPGRIVPRGRAVPPAPGRGAARSTRVPGVKKSRSR